MRKIAAIFLSLTLLLTSCTLPSEKADADNIGVSISESSDVDKSISVDRAEHDESSREKRDPSAEFVGAEDIGTIAVNDDSNFDIIVNGLDDEALIGYVEDNIYLNLVDQLNSEDYFVENVDATYYPKEYIEALASNSMTNVYFGYTVEELDEQFQGTRYVFTLGNNGQTVVIPMETFTDDVYVKAMEDVIIGTGVILVCVTVSFVSAPLAPAVSMVFAASASTAKQFALSSVGIAFVSAAIVKGYETESLEQAFNAGVVGAGKGFKWAAVTGMVYGGGKTFFALKGATLNGLSMNEVAKIQKESKYPLELIKQFKSYEEYEIYKKAGLYTKIVNGKMALVRDIDPDYVVTLKDGTKTTNLELMKDGKAPYDSVTGEQLDLHHINQEPDGTLAILTKSEHRTNSKILNKYGKAGVHNPETGDPHWNTKRKEFWQSYAKRFM